MEDTIETALDNNQTKPLQPQKQLTRLLDTALMEMRRLHRDLPDPRARRRLKRAADAASRAKTMIAALAQGPRSGDAAPSGDDAGGADPADRSLDDMTSPIN